MKIMIVNSKIKPKSKTRLAVIRNLILDFILYFVTAFMSKYPYDKQFTTVTTHRKWSKLLQ